MRAHLRPRIKDEPPVISERDKQIALLLAKEKLSKEIAYETGLSEQTVKTYIFFLTRKLGVRNRVGIALWASKNLGDA